MLNILSSLVDSYQEEALGGATSFRFADKGLTELSASCWSSPRLLGSLDKVSGGAHLPLRRKRQL